MDSLTIGLILTLGTIFVYTIVQKWWRRRRAAKLADELLADVIKGKDAFRRSPRPSSSLIHYSEIKMQLP